jgi:tRNA pseudouridine32 synthase/23S rRNA pseudouridine746 synthase/23S rRNA pseudouridine1911/1915/1917 synthase
LQNRKKFKSPPKRFQPKGLPVLYEDHDILVVDKRSGLLTVSNAKDRENTAYYMLTDYVRKGNKKSKNRIFIVHRLDRDTSGVIVFAKTEKAKHTLQEQWSAFKKTYSAVVCGRLSEKEGVITSYLAENSIHKMYSVNKRNQDKGKLAKTAYKVLKESEKYSLLEVDLLTGRKNQIRVHFAEKGFPVAGDKKYGGKAKNIKRLTLHAVSLTMVHPFTKEEMTFESKVPGYFYSLVSTHG